MIPWIKSKIKFRAIRKDMCKRHITGSGAAYKGRPCFALYADFSEGLDLQMVISDILLLEITYAAFSPIGNLLPAVLSRIFAFLRIIYIGPEKNRHRSTVFAEMRFSIKLLLTFSTHVEPGKVADPAFAYGIYGPVHGRG